MMTQDNDLIMICEKHKGGQVYILDGIPFLEYMVINKKQNPGVETVDVDLLIRVYENSNKSVKICTYSLTPQEFQVLKNNAKEL